MSSSSSSSTTTLEDYFSPPECVRGSKVLDRGAFQREVKLPAIKLQCAILCSAFLKRLAHARLRFPSIKSVLDEQDKEGTSKVILLAPHHLMKKPLSTEDHEWISAHGGEEITRPVSLSYADYSKHAILKAVLPFEVKDVPAGYESVGHIAHYNLRSEHLPYKYIIGQVTLDKQPTLRTVVNKTDRIDNTFRFFKMEVLAGDEDFFATVRENGCVFSFDFSHVYWNSRLGNEHERVVGLMERGETILDVFAGVGPFAIPAAKNRGCTVYANDLNPHSYRYLIENARKNHVTSKVLAYNLDARIFLRSISKNFVEKILSKVDQVGMYSHVVMNLPVSAVQFLDVFHGLFSSIPESIRPSLKLPFIHCYCFVDKLDTESEMEKVALLQVCSHLGVSDLSKESRCGGTVVRLVAPKRVMMCVSFILPVEVAYSSECRADKRNDVLEEDPKGEREEANGVFLEAEEPLSKRSKLEDE